MAEQRRAPSIYDVAQRAGVSHQTVSRVLNDYAGIRPATRERVLDAIRGLGYRRSVAARTLATSRTGSIGILSPATAAYGAVSSLLAVEHAVRDAGYRPLVTSVVADGDAVRAGVEFLLDHSVEALVAIAPYRVMLAELEGAGLPVLMLQAGDEGPDGVAVDQQAGVDALLDHLLALGHTGIQHIAGPSGYIEADLRRAAFARAVAARALPVLPLLQGDWTADAGHALAASVSPEASAIVAGNDQMALGVVHGLADRGLRVPDDMSVTGFDDIPEAAHCLPPLTTAHQDFAEIGRLAVARLVARLDGADAPEPATVAPRLVVRGSTAAPAHGGGAPA
ncbi:LacI family DNA-binding transcriptional regulator [Microbacterium betulae]|uniref:LacI family DNA-binding transcriptional regulator n=1 Tax=Microbacterium betulae TaxID=2981139 RepID=A0AA97FIC2_9MICO|nr:LacI family DNA-binding transcriptional regulator [Microbacterium sp. AB]WOF23119.1 LacI family DNA-binding transcriptional regulator [Microbacterium sp. AB]